MASVKTYGDTIHTFVQRVDYNGPFLPGFSRHHLTEVINTLLPIPGLGWIDHCVGNQGDGEMEAVASWYEKMLDFHRFWSVDDTMIHTSYSSLRLIVVTDFDERVKMPNDVELIYCAPRSAFNQIPSPKPSISKAPASAPAYSWNVSSSVVAYW